MRWNHRWTHLGQKKCYLCLSKVRNLVKILYFDVTGTMAWPQLTRKVWVAEILGNVSEELTPLKAYSQHLWVIFHINRFNEHSQEPYSLSIQKIWSAEQNWGSINSKKQLKKTLKIPDAIVPGKDSSKFGERGLVTSQYAGKIHAGVIKSSPLHHIVWSNKSTARRVIFNIHRNRMYRIYGCQIFPNNSLSQRTAV